MVGHDDVQGIGECNRQTDRDPDSVDGNAAPEVDDERKAAERERKGEPDAPPHPLVLEEPSPERDEHRGDVLDDERNSDVQASERLEVEELDEGEPADSEDDEEAELSPLDPKPLAARREDDGEEKQRRAGRARFGE